MKTKKTAKKTAPAKAPGEAPALKAPKFGILGKDLSSQFSSRGDRAWRPTKPGGRNSNGKPS